MHPAFHQADPSGDDSGQDILNGLGLLGIEMAS